MKTCNRCKLDKPLSEFSKLSSARDGLQYKCKACAKAYRDARLAEVQELNRAYYSENRESIRQKSRTRYAESPELRAKIQEGNRSWASRNQEQVKANARRYYLQNKDRIDAYTSNWQSRNQGKRREYVSKYDSANRDKHRAVMARRKAALLGCPSVRFSSDQLAERMSYFGNRCWMCGGPFEHVDHVKPLSKGGPDCLSNLRPACARCNMSKSSKWPFDTRLRS